MYIYIYLLDSLNTDNTGTFTGKVLSFHNAFYFIFSLPDAAGAVKSRP